MAGALTLLAGCFIVSFHWVWQGMAIIVSLTGVILVLKGAIYLLYPNWLPVKLATLEHHDLKKLIRLSGIVIIILAGAILYEWSGANMRGQYSLNIDKPVQKTTITEIASQPKKEAVRLHRQL